MVTALEYVQSTAKESAQAREAFVKRHAEDLVQGARWMGDAVAAGGKVLICGNGGSAADAQHMAAEMVGRMILDRRPLAAIALTTDSSNLTALGNDFGFETVFAKQVEALAKPQDVLVVFSTSGNSKNVVLAVEAAKKVGCRVIALTGGSGGVLAKKADLSLNVSEGKNSCRIQESHLFALHTLVDVLDRYFLINP